MTKITSFSFLLGIILAISTQSTFTAKAQDNSVQNASSGDDVKTPVPIEKKEEQQNWAMIRLG